MAKPIGHEIHELDNILGRNMMAHQSRMGRDEVTVMHGWIIGFLYRHREEDIFQKDIENRYSMARSTTATILKLMEKKGYIRRIGVKEDARLKKIVLTEKGVEMNRETERIINYLEERLLRGISEEELEIFLCVLRRMKANAQEDEKNYKTEERKEKG